jgi:pyrroloquinoline quinone biosynthesis protein B
VLTGAEIDQIAGLLTLRERQPLALYAAGPILGMLAANPIFHALAEDVVDRIAIGPGQSFSPRGCDGLQVTMFAVPGKAPLYAEAKKDAPDEDMTFGLRLADPATGGSMCFVPACAAVTDDLIAAIEDANVLLFDGTLYSDDELIAQDLSPKTGARMGHVAMSGSAGSMVALRRARVGRRMFIHINNSNPVLREDSAERGVLAHQGWEIASDGAELIL